MRRFNCAVVDCDNNPICSFSSGQGITRILLCRQHFDKDVVRMVGGWAVWPFRSRSRAMIWRRKDLKYVNGTIQYVSTKFDGTRL